MLLEGHKELSEDAEVLGQCSITLCLLRISEYLGTVALFCHSAPPLNYFCKLKRIFPNCSILGEGQGKKELYESHILFCVRVVFVMWVITLHSQLYKESLEIVLLDVIHKNHGTPEKLYSSYQIDIGNCVTDHKVSLLELITEKLSQPSMATKVD